jgi:hypothetical protein
MPPEPDADLVQALQLISQALGPDHEDDYERAAIQFHRRRRSRSRSRSGDGGQRGGSRFSADQATAKVMTATMRASSAII